MNQRLSLGMDLALAQSRAAVLKGEPAGGKFELEQQS